MTTMSSKDTIFEKSPRKPEDISRPLGVEEALFGEEHDPGSVQIIASDHVVNYKTKVLTDSEVIKCLSMIGKTGKGDGYTYLKASCTAMSLTNVSILAKFEHLQFINVSNNHLDLGALQPLTKLPYLISLQADVNVLKSAALDTCRCLQVLILNNNKISSVSNIYHPHLSTLEMGMNKLARVNFDKNMPEIRCLDFRNNYIIDITSLNFPNLDSLYLAGNRITSLEGLDNMTNLRILHLRNNPIKKLDGFSNKLAKLQYINLRNCKVERLRQIKKLKGLVSLETLVLKGCPYMGGSGEEFSESLEEEEEENPELRIEVLATLMRLKRLNKNNITPEEMNEAKELFRQWLEEGEKEEDDVEEEEDDVGQY